MPEDARSDTGRRAVRPMTGRQDAHRRPAPEPRPAASVVNEPVPEDGPSHRRPPRGAAYYARKRGGGPQTGYLLTAVLGLAAVAVIAFLVAINAGNVEPQDVSAPARVEESPEE
jgi:hypothetical protein